MEAHLRASLFNLILYSQKNERVDYVRKIMQKVIERFPSRVIFITVDKSSTQDQLTIRASTLQANTDVICDLIEIEATEKTKEQIPFAILPRILPDLPVYLLWAENPIVENPLSHQLDTFATRMIFDSESTDNLPLFAKAVLEHKDQAGCDVADLNWARTESWRELLLVTFYSDERLKQLERAQTITITYNAYETPYFCHTQIQAIYLQGWLVTRMGWKEKGPTITLQAAQNADLPPGVVISFDLMTSSGEHFSFTRNKDHPHQVSMVLCTPEKCEIPAKHIFTKSQSGLSLVNEIGFNGTSQHYLELLSYLSTRKEK